MRISRIFVLLSLMLFACSSQPIGKDDSLVTSFELIACGVGAKVFNYKKESSVSECLILDEKNLNMLNDWMNYRYGEELKCEGRRSCSVVGHPLISSDFKITSTEVRGEALFLTVDFEDPARDIVIISLEKEEGQPQGIREVIVYMTVS